MMHVGDSFTGRARGAGAAPARPLLACAVLLASLSAGGCRNRVGEAGGGVLVMVSVPPQTFFVEKVGGVRVQAVSMIPREKNPHSYEPTPDKMKEVAKADLYVKVGHPRFGFEAAYFDKIRGLARGMHVVNSARGVKLREDDVHVWLSPGAVMVQAENIRDGLVEVDPGGRRVYEENLLAFQAELRELDEELRGIIAGKGKPKILTYHPAFGYLAEEYGFEQIAVERAGKSPGARDLEELIERARDEEIDVVFVSPQFDRESAELVAEAVGGEVRMLDPLDPDWEKTMREIIGALKEAAGR